MYRKLFIQFCAMMDCGMKRYQETQNHNNMPCHWEVGLSVVNWGKELESSIGKLVAWTSKQHLWLWLVGNHVAAPGHLLLSNAPKLRFSNWNPWWLGNSHKRGYPQNGCFIMENPIKMVISRGTPHFFPKPLRWRVVQGASARVWGTGSWSAPMPGALTNTTCPNDLYIRTYYNQPLLWKIKWWVIEWQWEFNSSS